MNIKLLIAFLVLPFCGKGQIIIKDSIGVDRMPNPYSLQLMTAPQVNDTVKCIMLVCDTVDISNGSSTVFFIYRNTITGTEIGREQDHIPYVFWKVGYACTTDSPYYKYLDENKKPLPKNIIVWMSKNTEP